MTAEQLKEQFATIATEQNKALLWNEISKFNRLFDKLESIEQELRAREGDQRKILLTLYDHNNPQVRLTAAKATLAVAPEAARALLQKIAGSKEYPQAGDAGMSLWNLDRGVFKPT
jgi:HEAT repeat protein